MQLRVGIMDGYDPLEARQQDRLEPTVNTLPWNTWSATPCRTNGPPASASIEKLLTMSSDQRWVVACPGRRQTRPGDAAHIVQGNTLSRKSRARTALQDVFSCDGLGMGECHPAHGISRFREEKRERWLTEEELHRFSKALDSYSDQNAADALRLLLLTGAREGEALKAHWPQFDLQRGVWTKPSHHTKEKKIEHVPFSAAALGLLRRMKRTAGATAGPLFPGANCTGARVTLRKPWIQICKAAGLSVAFTRQGKRRIITRWKPTLRIHDLRHSFASHLVSNGISLHVVGKLLGHTQSQTTQRYAHVADRALRDASNRMGEIFKTASKGKKRS